MLVYDEDWDWLMAEFGQRGRNTNVSPGQAIRTIIHAKVLDMKRKANVEFDRIRQDMEADAASNGASDE